MLMNDIISEHNVSTRVYNEEEESIELAIG